MGMPRFGCVLAITAARNQKSRTMHSHELLRTILDEFGFKRAAAEVKVSESLLYKWAEPKGGNGSGTVNPLDRVSDLLGATGDTRIVSWICERAGGYFVRNTDVPAHSDQLAPAASRVFHQVAAILSVIAASVEDSHITRAEAKAIRAEWEGLKSYVEGFVTSCERGTLNSRSPQESKLAVPSQQPL